MDQPSTYKSRGFFVFISLIVIGYLEKITIYSFVIVFFVTPALFVGEFLDGITLNNKHQTNKGGRGRLFVVYSQTIQA